MMAWEFMTDVKELQKLLTFWNDSAKKASAEAEYYREELVQAHAMIGRLTMQLSERWDVAKLTKYEPSIIRKINNKEKV